jgi:hypothetical protein
MTVRRIVFSHVAAVAICLGMTLANSGLLINREISRFYYDYIGILVFASLLAWVVCPVLLLVAWARKRVPNEDATLGVIAESLLCVAQHFVLIPAF